HEPEKIGREQRAQRHLEAVRFEIRDELRDPEAAARALLGNWRECQQTDWLGAHRCLSFHARAIGSASTATVAPRTARASGRIHRNGASSPDPRNWSRNAVIAAIVRHAPDRRRRSPGPRSGSPAATMSVSRRTPELAHAHSTTDLVVSA